MNWAIFSWIGYVSVGLWLCMPLLWLWHEWRRPRRWLAHVALGVGLVALALATVNSRSYVNRIEVDRSEQIAEQQARAQQRRKAAEDQRAEEVAGVRYIEDAAGDFLDIGGMTEEDVEFFQSLDEQATPDWKREKQSRDATAGGDTDDLESKIGGSEERTGMESAVLAEETVEPIYMSEKDKSTADRLDGLNLKLIRVMIGLAAAYLLVDYLRRLNRDDEIYFPLPIPSRWADGITPRPTLQAIDHPRPEAMLQRLRTIARRGEAFIYMTDNSTAAAEATTSLPRLPRGFWPMQVLNVASNPKLTDEFVFETLWFGRHSFVVDSVHRAEQMLEYFAQFLAQRRGTRAHTRQMVHIIWDLPAAIPQTTVQRLAKLGERTGYRLVLCSR